MRKTARVGSVKIGELSIEDEVEVLSRERDVSGRVKQRGGPTKVAAVSGA